MQIATGAHAPVEIVERGRRLDSGHRDKHVGRSGAVGLMHEPEQPGVAAFREDRRPVVAVQRLEPIGVLARDIVRLVNKQHGADGTQTVRGVHSESWCW